MKAQKFAVSAVCVVTWILVLLAAPAGYTSAFCAIVVFIGIASWFILDAIEEVLQKLSEKENEKEKDEK